METSINAENKLPNLLEKVKSMAKSRILKVLLVALTASCSGEASDVINAQEKADNKIDLVLDVDNSSPEINEHNFSKHERLVASYKVAFQEEYNVISLLDHDGNIVETFTLDPLYFNIKTKEYLTQEEADEFKEKNPKTQLSKIQPLDSRKKINSTWLNSWRKKVSPDDFTTGQYPKYMSTSGFLRGELEAGRIDSSETFLDVVWKNSQEIVPGTSKSKLDYLKEELDKDTIISDKLKYIAAYGEVGIESTFNDFAKSAVGARGAFQFLKPTGRNYGLKISGNTDERTDFAKASVAFRKYLSDIYQEMDSLPSMIKIREEFKLDADGWFQAFATINGFHSGENRIVAMLDWFAKNYDKAQVLAALGKDFTEKDLYSFMTEQRRSSRLDKKFGNHSAGYHLQIKALADLMADYDVMYPIKQLKGKTATPVEWNYEEKKSE